MRSICQVRRAGRPVAGDQFTMIRMGTCMGMEVEHVNDDFVCCVQVQPKTGLRLSPQIFRRRNWRGQVVRWMRQGAEFCPYEENPNFKDDE